MNLYQYGFLSVKGVVPVQREGTNLLPQMFTELCMKVEVPQTGKAVSGFCPKVVQVCADTNSPTTDKNKSMIRLLASISAQK